MYVHFRRLGGARKSHYDASAAHYLYLHVPMIPSAVNLELNCENNRRTWLTPWPGLPVQLVA